MPCMIKEISMKNERKCRGKRQQNHEYSFTLFHQCEYANKYTARTDLTMRYWHSNEEPSRRSFVKR